MNTHERHIKRCLQIAKNGLGYTRPNPMVGAVITYNDTIIGEGFTSPYGGNHAEVNAIDSVQDKSLLKHATLYVTLEPCSHYGKTPPCSDLIIHYNIPNIVIGCLDDNPQVAGRGIQKLLEAGRQVKIGVLEDACKTHHKRFFTFHNKKRPYVILKWAETSDGFIAPKHRDEKKPVWITTALSRQLVHKWRAEEQAILVGTQTVLQDNPSLTVRDWTGQNPTRIVLDKNTILGHSHTIFNADAETLRLKETRAKTICDALYKHNITSVIIEGGAKTLQLFINENIWDEARVFTGNITFNYGVKAPQFQGKTASIEHLGIDKLTTYHPLQ
ncbi:bifunctional diaminohydroxyphosphoribosylaminopyrimidine deaminase/5-amino-6-(5-phosphoribosylamino)uracil reductase RibD [Bizionia saleffrena]|uniref:Riboflavin biosynthesis protein RibD n=1 Tax=Bizionia saleffrena TaxID=291189 RepID=A0A8H2QMF1_9FLAO|nr:bifunctional diaminohydroxyphosphoribosylaminopyrimidine deaminase/5-amino-6-(5-phosphoribosylamino)uracil reductase RibD [Bizionia saleffrena]TYB77385.1 bifunctional diaminohydroxyphosphoribosylaminopyrimidine deaminase/5-amino-6-(5-phosphoribosylamino)uracil reductase RibD [Bizionia saleffrena]